MKRFIVMLFVAASLPATESAPLVVAPAGTLRGAAVGDIRVFKGIPYALPPTGPMRGKPRRRQRHGRARAVLHDHKSLGYFAKYAWRNSSITGGGMP